MATNKNFPEAAGCLVFLGFILGAGIGIARGEPSIGVLAGVGIAAALGLLLWLWGRRAR